MKKDIYICDNNNKKKKERKSVDRTKYSIYPFLRIIRFQLLFADHIRKVYLCLRNS